MRGRHTDEPTLKLGIGNDYAALTSDKLNVRIS